MTFTDSQISKWAQDYEREITAKHDLIAERISLPIIAGQGTYELPNYVTNIRSVLYKGKELHPKGGRASILTGDTPFSTSQNAPYEYQFSGLGLRVLRLLPTPGDTIAEYTDDLWSVEADAAACIIEFYRVAEYDEYDRSKMLPKWLRRFVLKDQVCWKAFSSEGPGIDLRAGTYYENKRQGHEMMLKQVWANLTMCYQRVLTDNKMVGRRKPGRPVLPPSFGYPTYGG